MSDFDDLQRKIANRARDRQRNKDKKLDKLYSKLGMQTMEERKQEQQDKLDWEYNKIPLETKQKFLDLMWSGKNVGQAAAECGIDSMMGAQIILRNAVETLPRKAYK